MSSAMMESTAPMLSRLTSRALLRLLRKPVTTSSSTWADSSAAGALWGAGEVCAMAALAMAKATAEAPEANRRVFKVVEIIVVSSPTNRFDTGVLTRPTSLKMWNLFPHLATSDESLQLWYYQFDARCGVRTTK
jgi:hypothetical protein